MGAEYTISVQASPRTSASGGNCSASETENVDTTFSGTDLGTWSAITVTGPTFGYTTFTTTFNATATSGQLQLRALGNSSCDVIIDNVSVTLNETNDLDGDGLLDIIEVCTTMTDVDDVDTDSDGFCDGSVRVATDAGYGTCAYCGDAFTDGPTEDCDDNNDTDNDGCTACSPDVDATCVETPAGGTSVCTFPASALGVHSLSRTIDGRLEVTLAAMYGTHATYIEWATDSSEESYTRLERLPLPAVGLGIQYRETMPSWATYGRIVEESSSGATRVVRKFKREDLPLSGTKADSPSVTLPRMADQSVLYNLEAETAWPYRDSAGLSAWISQEGINGFRFSQLAELSGRDTSNWRDRCEAGQLLLTISGEESRYHCGDDGVQFYLPRVDSHYDHNVAVKLQYAGGQLEPITTTIQANGDDAPASFSRSLRFEEDSFPATAVETSSATDLFYWAFLSEWGATNAIASFEHGRLSDVRSIEIAAVAETPIAEISLWNGESRIGGMRFSKGDLSRQSIHFEASESMNETALVARIESGTLLVDSITYEIPAEQTASPERLTALGVGTWQNVSSGWDVTDPLNPERWMSNSSAGLSVEMEHDYIGETEIHWLTMTNAAEDELASNAEDVLVVYPNSFQELADKYQALHPQYSMQLTSIETLYSAYRSGQSDPHAITAAIRERRENGVPVSTVVLIGDGHLDYRGILDTTPNLVPPKLIPTGFGLYPSDFHLGGDDQVVVARIPVRTVEEGTRYLKRISEYQEFKSEETEGKILRIVGSGQVDFLGQMDRIAQSPFTIDETLDDLSALSVENDLRFSQALYLGHGGLTTLGQTLWLYPEDFQEIAPPFFIAGTCLINAFSYPGDIEGFGETMIRNGGTLLNLAPAYPTNTRSNRFGVRDWLATAEQNLAAYETVAASDILRREFSLLGDPLLRNGTKADEEASPEKPRTEDDEATQASSGCAASNSQNSSHLVLIWALLAIIVCRSRRSEHILRGNH